ncbi:type I polyketide synthase [Polyangium sp. 15x6]|uniref:type I polyketide synthase n=1 Tax=Polyangium sp. 15x6 TaxID=3042687 RepID=UPI00249B3EAE|nr:type I polyketide synthase [Polyangium sp. 15x6]MDI3287043.1 type I polyketide synthase [Polyangium sp. 15x6]
MSGISRTEDYKALLQRAFVSLEQMQARLAETERARTEPIAVVGVGCRFPGGADNPDSFFRLLRDGVDATCEVPPDRYDIDAYYDPDPTAPGKVNVRRGGYLRQVDQFDPQFFGISPREAALMDPQQRLFLEVTWEALEEAGIDPTALSGSATGVFVGVYNDDYEWSEASAGAITDACAATGTSHAVLAGRLSFLLDLRGPSIAVDTACSSSLVTVHLACQSLRGRECDVAIVGGVNLILGPRASVLLSKLQVLAGDGRCKTFDARANGFARGEGAGVVVLKRLSSALADGDRIHAVIRGSAINHDGRSAGLTAPNPRAQAALVRAALSAAGVEPADIAYVEAHGTGTPLGDPIEIEGLAEALGPRRSSDRPCLLGSVKTNLGHLEAAAGIAGLIKVVLSLEHGVIPPHLHFTQLNPRISFEGTPFAIPTAPSRWPAGRRCAGVSSFGIGGTNVHVVLEEAPRPAAAPIDAEPRAFMLPLSARSPGALAALARSFQAFLAQEGGAALPLRDICFTAGAGRAHHAERLAMVASSREELAERLEGFLSGRTTPSVLAGAVAQEGPGKLVFVFPGQGSQWAGMARRLMREETVFREALERCDAALRPHVGESLLARLSEDDASDWLSRIELVQPALFAIQVALAAQLRGWGIEPDAVVGHSMGEVAAAHVAGALALEDAARIIGQRSRLLRRISGRGAMAVLELSPEHTQRALEGYEDRLSIAVINGPTSTVVSGDAAALDELLERVRQKNVFCRAVKVDVASHSPQVDELCPDLLAALEGIEPRDGSVPICSTVTGHMSDGREFDAGYWLRNLREPVQFWPAVRRLIDAGHRLFIELSPHPVLVPAIEQALGAAGGGGAALPSMRRGEDERTVLMEMLGALYTRGYLPDFRRLYPGALRTALPTYPFQRMRCWREPARIEAARPRASLRASAALHPLLGARLPTAQPIFEASIGTSALPYLAHHRMFGAVIFPGAAYIEMALAAADPFLGARPHEIRSLSLEEPLSLTESAQTVQLVWTSGAMAQGTFEIFSMHEDPGANPPHFRRHAAGEVRVVNATPIGPAPAELSFDGGGPEGYEEVDTGSHYERLGKTGIELGPLFRGLSWLRRRGGEAWGSAALPEALHADADAYRMHPALLDAALQVLGAALPDPPEADAGLWVLSGIERIRFFRRAGRTLLSHARAFSTDARASATGEVRLFDEKGAPIAVLEGITLRRLPRAAMMRLAAGQADGWMYDLGWKLRPLPAAPPAPGARRRWLILSDAVGTGDALAALLKAHGQACWLVRPGDTFARSLEGHARVRPSELEDFERLIREAVHEEGGCEGVIHLLGLDAGPLDERADVQSADASAASLEQAQRWGSGSALLVARALANVGGAAPPRLWLVTQGAQAVGSTPDGLRIAQAPLWGLGRGIALELPEVWGGLVDLEPCHPSQAARALWAQMASADGEDQAAFRGGQRYVPRLRRFREGPAQGRLSLRSDGSYLITGALGGLGLQVAAWLVERGARHLVLLGRRGLPAGDLGAQRKASLKALEAAGASVHVVTGDVADARYMEELLGELGRTAPPLRGVVHAATASSAIPLREMSTEELRAMLRPKVLGAWNLHRLTRAWPLDFFVLFSSTTTLWGASGLAHYAAANQFLDVLAHHRRSLGLPALCVDWGTWSDGRGTSSETRQSALRSGLLEMDPEGALAVLERLLVQGETHKVVAAVDFNVLKPLYEAKRQRPLLEEIEIAPAATPLGARSTLLAMLAEARPTARRKLLLAHVQDEVARILHIPASSPIQPRQGFFQMGMDSLTSVELRNRLQAALGCPLPTTLAFEHPTAEALADFLAGKLFPPDPGDEHADAPPKEGERAAEATEVSARRRAIEELTDDEAEEQLAARLAGLADRLSP